MTDAATWTKALTLVGIVFVAYLVMMWVVMVFWTHRDIASRSDDRILRVASVLVVALFSLPGFLVYLTLRPPETSADIQMRQLEAEALVLDMARQQACPDCGRGIDTEFVACPYCGTSVETSCLACTRSLRAAWVLCPYCGADRSVTLSPTPDPMPMSPERIPTSPALQPAGHQRVLVPTAKA